LIKESASLLAVFGAGLAFSCGLYARFRSPVFLAGGALFLLLLLFTLFFFRNPDRRVPRSAEAVLAPADGRIVEVGQVQHAPYLEGPAHKVAIFLSVWDVHVNRIPVDGRVTFLSHRPGAFLRAYLPNASERNEQMWIGVESPRGKFLTKQIAGILARRIVCRLREGDSVEKGSRFGMIKFGSRVELYCPPSVAIRVAVGDHVKAGETIIGEIPHVQ
jgi:phosphatidylserine decarboxylase